jgi:23S rRNA pseudouridine1911/1915/1917 synthase
MRELTFIAEESDEGLTALDFLKRKGFSRRIITSVKQTGGLTRNGCLLRTIDRIRSGDSVRVVMLDEGGAAPNADIAAKIVYEDEDVVVFDKPPFLPVHPSQNHYSDTLANLFAALYPNAPFRPINRLDKNTSGLCVCAKNRLAAAKLSGSLEKVYFAAVDRIVTEPFEVNLPIGRADGSIIKRCVSEDGKPAVTHCEPLDVSCGRTLLRITLLTGRTHQIRVHLSHIGMPLCGDDMYGGDCSKIARQALHCGEVSFLQPISGERITVVAELPEDMKKLFVSEN